MDQALEEVQTEKAGRLEERRTSIVKLDSMAEELATVKAQVPSASVLCEVCEVCALAEGGSARLVRAQSNSTLLGAAVPSLSEVCTEFATTGVHERRGVKSAAYKNPSFHSPVTCSCSPENESLWCIRSH